VIGVLVVDDDFRVARIHGRFVEQTPGFEVVGTAHTGHEALRLVGELQPGLVLLDVHLPDIDGLEVLDRLRGAGHQVAVVMVTAERGAAAVRSALHGGAMQYLVKPFEYADLEARLRRVADALGPLAGQPGSDDSRPVDQIAIDRAFGAGPTQPQAVAPLPKGLSPETADLLLDVLQDSEEVTASDAAEAVGLSRVTARRYLEHFVDTGQAEVRLQYGAAGRPQRRYRRP
jgi:response regulator of citrate/malate metabolism